LVSILAGLLLGIEIPEIAKSVQKGIGDMLGSLVVIIITARCWASWWPKAERLNELRRDDEAPRERYIQWAADDHGVIIGIPLFYSVGFVLVVPFIFSVAYQYKLPAVYIGVRCWQPFR